MPFLFISLTTSETFSISSLPTFKIISFIKIGDKDIETASDVIKQISKNGIKKQLNILLKRKNKFIKLKVIPTDITNLQNN